MFLFCRVWRSHLPHFSDSKSTIYIYKPNSTNTNTGESAWCHHIDVSVFGDKRCIPWSPPPYWVGTATQINTLNSRKTNRSKSGNHVQWTTRPTTILQPKTNGSSPAAYIFVIYHTIQRFISKIPASTRGEWNFFQDDYFKTSFKITKLYFQASPTRSAWRCIYSIWRDCALSLCFWFSFSVLLCLGCFWLSTSGNGCVAPACSHAHVFKYWYFVMALCNSPRWTWYPFGRQAVMHRALNKKIEFASHLKVSLVIFWTEPFWFGA